ncbi:MAG: FAD/NAD(P)-binding protein [Gammaproteobacteria bacterium]|nr:FAD/NAD(P)-binding protein [Gammaproteobacteria bacterium]
MNRIITIVGGGAVGVSVLYQLIKKKASELNTSGFEINLFEKDLIIGPGLAYSMDDATNLLNRPANTMSAVHGDQKSFINWLNSMGKAACPGISSDIYQNQFLPRKTFGMYLKMLFDKALMLAKVKNIKVNVIHSEVINVKKKQNLYSVEALNGQVYLTQALILATGHTNSNIYEDLRRSEHYLDSPYPTSRVATLVPSAASVAILGSRLSAIDAAIALNSHGHKGKIAFVSRYGYLPSIRVPGILDYKLKIFTTNTLNAYQSISLKQIINLIVDEVSIAIGRKVRINEWFYRTNDFYQFFKDELSCVNFPDKIIWQSVMISINKVIELAWYKLNDRDKEIFIKRYKSRWMAYRVGIPAQNALIINSLIENNKLVCIKGLKKVSYDDAIKKFSIHIGNKSKKVNFDYVINATGSCSDIKNNRSLLLKNMRKNGLIKPHNFGGIEVDFQTSRVKDENDFIQKNLYAIGQLTEGAYFFTSVLELNIAHADIITDSIINNFNCKLTNNENLNFNYNERVSC